MKKYFSYILLFGVIPAFAQTPGESHTTEREAITVAINVLKMRGYTPSVLYSVFSIPCGNHVALYEVAFESGQSVIVSGHIVESPVISVCEHANGVSIIQHPEEFPPEYRYMLERINSVQHSCHNKMVTDSIWQVWSRFLTNSADSSEFLTRAQIIGPLLTTKWAQRCGRGCGACCNDYNKYMPLTNDTCNEDTIYRSPTGCTLTAIGQVMNYWKYPILRSDKPLQIDWCNMPDSISCYEGSETPEIAKEAVARLMKTLKDDLGGVYGPGFGFLDPAIALITMQIDYGYSLSADCLCRSFHETEWKDLILNEILEGRPVIYWAFEEKNPLRAHTFVCDGYNPNDNTFHFNWGHGVGGDWVSLSDLHENGNNTHWNDYQWAMVKFEPGITGDFCNGYVWLTAFYDKFYRSHHTDEYPPHTVVPGTMAYLYSADATDRYIYRTIPENATATYQAHKEIVLRDGFTVEEGADFTAQIVPCPNCENRGEDVVVEEPGDTDANAEGADTDGTLNARPLFAEPMADLYPNPTSWEVTVSVDGEVQAIVIYNAMGQPVGGWKLQALEDGVAILDVSSLPTGNYLLTVRTTDNIVTKKLVVQRR